MSLQQQIHDYYAAHNSPLASHAGQIVAISESEHVDPRLIVGISAIESGSGTALFRPYNAWGWDAHGGTQFTSWGQAIRAVAHGLRTGYLDSGLTSVGQIQQRYAPGSDGNNASGWKKTVSGVIRALGGNPSNVQYGTSAKVPAALIAAAQANAVTYRKWVTGDTKKLNPALLTAIGHLGHDLRQKIKIVSGYRSHAEQAHLYALFLAGKGNLAAKPGTSHHETGNAADCYIGTTPLANFPGARAKAAALGLGFPVPGEAWHVELTGAASSASSAASSASAATPSASGSTPAGLTNVGLTQDVTGALQDLATEYAGMGIWILVIGAGATLALFGIARTFGVTGQVKEAGKSGAELAAALTLAAPK